MCTNRILEVLRNPREIVQVEEGTRKNVVLKLIPQDGERLECPSLELNARACILHTCCGFLSQPLASEMPPRKAIPVFLLV